jgi:hypothetical protein
MIADMSHARLCPSVSHRRLTVEDVGLHHHLLRGREWLVLAHVIATTIILLHAPRVRRVVLSTRVSAHHLLEA